MVPYVLLEVGISNGAIVVTGVCVSCVVVEGRRVEVLILLEHCM